MSIGCQQQVCWYSDPVDWMEFATLYKGSVSASEIERFPVNVFAPRKCMSISKDEEETFDFNAFAGMEQNFQAGRTGTVQAFEYSINDMKAFRRWKLVEHPKNGALATLMRLDGMIQ